MNPTLTDAEKDSLLEVLYEGLLAIRAAASAGDAARSAAIADALHNLPHLLSHGQERMWTIHQFQELFLSELVEKYPDLASLAQPLKRQG